MPRESKIIKHLRELRVFNSFDFYGDEPYIDRYATDYRSVTPSYWAVIKRGEKLADAWYARWMKMFSYHDRDGVQPALERALVWASEKFGVKEWTCDPFGSYGSKEYVERRLKELLGMVEGKEGVRSINSRGTLP